MFSSATTHDFGQSMVDEWRDGVEVLDYTLGVVNLRAVRKGANPSNVPRPSCMGFPICIPLRHRDGPFCPIYSLTLGLGACGCSLSVAPASAMVTSPPFASVGSSVKPKAVGTMALGVSSPAYPARREDVPKSRTSAETSSVAAMRGVSSIIYQY